MEGRSSAASSPEFEFWPLSANPAASPSCADELFADGVLLPLPLLPTKPPHDPHPDHEASAAITIPAPPAAPGGSKRWTDIFAKKPSPVVATTEDRDKRKDVTAARKPAAAATSELNINIWPFSRSRSAGGGSAKPRPTPRKSSSAPCSRSNSRGEAPAAPPPRRWAASPGRAGGVPLGRSSPVWQPKRPAKHGPAELHPQPPADKRAQKDKLTGGKRSGGGGVRGINLSVNSCIGYRHQVSCRRVDTGGVRTPGEGGGGLFGIKGFFSKKVH